MDAKELKDTIFLLEGYQATLGALFKKVLNSYGAHAPSVQAVHEAETAVAEAIGELNRAVHKPPPSKIG